MTKEDLLNEIIKRLSRDDASISIESRANDGHRDTVVFVNRVRLKFYNINRLYAGIMIDIASYEDKEEAYNYIRSKFPDYGDYKFLGLLNGVLGVYRHGNMANGAETRDIYLEREITSYYQEIEIEENEILDLLDKVKVLGYHEHPWTSFKTAVSILKLKGVNY